MASTEPSVGSGPSHTGGYRPTVFSTLESISEYPRTVLISESNLAQEQDEVHPPGPFTSNVVKEHSMAMEYSDLLQESSQSQGLLGGPKRREERSHALESSHQVANHRVRPVAESTDPCDGSIQVWGDVLNTAGMNLQEATLGQCSVSSLPRHDVLEHSQEKSCTKPRRASQTSISEGSPAVLTDTLQTLTESQKLAIQIAQAEYILLLLRNERIQQHRTFTGLLSTLTTEHVVGRTKELLRFKEMEQVARVNAACRDFMHITDEVMQRLTKVLTPLMPLRIRRLNEAMESIHALKLKDVSLFPIPETILSVQRLTAEVQALLDRIQPRGGTQTHLPTGRKNITNSEDLEVLSNIGRLALRLQGLIHEQAVLHARRDERPIQ